MKSCWSNYNIEILIIKFKFIEGIGCHIVNKLLITIAFPISANKDFSNVFNTFFVLSFSCCTIGNYSLEESLLSSFHII